MAAVALAAWGRGLSGLRLRWIDTGMPDFNKAFLLGEEEEEEEEAASGLKKRPRGCCPLLLEIGGRGDDRAELCVHAMRRALKKFD